MTELLCGVARGVLFLSQFVFSSWARSRTSGEEHCKEVEGNEIGERVLQRTQCQQEECKKRTLESR